MALAGYKPSLAAYKKVLGSVHVKKRMQDIAERVLCDGWRQAADIVVAEPTKEAVIMKLWEFATSVSPPAASQVTALNALARNYGISVGVEEGAGGDDDDERPPPASQAHRGRQVPGGAHERGPRQFGDYSE